MNKRKEKKKKQRQRLNKRARQEKRLQGRHDEKKKRVEAPPTANGRKIRDFMIAHKVNGNFRDYVIFSGDAFIDWLGTYKAVAEDGNPIRVEGTALIHKKKLKNLVGDKAAKKFWHPVFGRVGAEKVRRDGRRKN